ncbi:hypothetical protein M1247_21915 [Mycobacterium sp. 21AC1]|uniref:hypothetical protein n=1 Tax=[Mycobacterium] appelbergii TaxID=2939269 RepID=UPI0029391B13|nr:hypothetical protein [Mycobacterium sp. 21AC1]MDV3127598.1 hypothetical protein [Mycobacterium sp. 21AC1]
MPRKRTAAQKLREQLDAALARVSEERHGDPDRLDWDERELQHLAAAEAAADLAERLTERLVDPDVSTSLLIKLAAERRIQLKSIADHIGALTVWATIPKSERHVKAGQYRMRSAK